MPAGAGRAPCCSSPTSRSTSPGSGTFWAGDRKWELGSGDTAHLPRGVPHAYAFPGHVELLTVCTPAGMEDFFRAVGWDLARPQPAGWAVDVQALAAAGEATGQHVLAPPLTPRDEMPEEPARR